MHLQAAIFFIALVNSYECCTHVRKQTTVEIPVPATIQLC